MFAVSHFVVFVFTVQEVYVPIGATVNVSPTAQLVRMWFQSSPHPVCV